MADLGGVFVNVPLFRLWAYDPERPDEPLRMEYVVFRPYWNPPPSRPRHRLDSARCPLADSGNGR